MMEALDRGEHVPAVEGDDPEGSRKPQWMIDKEMRDLKEASKSQSIEETDGYIVIRKGFSRMALPKETMSKEKLAMLRKAIKGYKLQQQEEAKKAS